MSDSERRELGRLVIGRWRKMMTHWEIAGLVVVFLLLILGEKLDDICLSSKTWKRLELAAGLILFALLVVFPLWVMRAQ